MTIEVNDTRNKSKTVLWDDLEQGKVYIDYEGDYLIYTESETLVSLVDGQVIMEDDYSEGRTFIPVKCKLEVYG